MSQPKSLTNFLLRTRYHALITHVATFAPATLATLPSTPRDSRLRVFFLLLARARRSDFLRRAARFLTLSLPWLCPIIPNTLPLISNIKHQFACERIDLLAPTRFGLSASPMIARTAPCLRQPPWLRCRLPARFPIATCSMSHASLAAPFAVTNIKNSSVTTAHLPRRLVTSKVQFSRRYARSNSRALGVSTNATSNWPTR
jgi:hypothetical protein